MLSTWWNATCKGGRKAIAKWKENIFFWIEVNLPLKYRTRRVKWIQKHSGTSGPTKWTFIRTFLKILLLLAPAIFEQEKYSYQKMPEKNNKTSKVPKQMEKTYYHTEQTSLKFFLKKDRQNCLCAWQIINETLARSVQKGYGVTEKEFLNWTFLPETEFYFCWLNVYIYIYVFHFLWYARVTFLGLLMTVSNSKQ